MWGSIFIDPIKGVLLDLDDTLYAYKSCHEKALDEWSRIVSIDLNITQRQAVEAYQEARIQINTQLHGLASSHSRLLYSQFVAEKYAAAAQNIIDWNNTYWDTFISHMTLFPNVIPFLEKCKKQNIKIALVSDMTTEIQLKKLIHLKIDHYFDVIITSERSGQEKPFAQPFLLALHKLSLTAKDVIMVGDSEKKDMQGAKLLGIKSYIPFFDNDGVCNVK